MQPFRYALAIGILISIGAVPTAFAQAINPTAAFRVERDMPENPSWVIPPPNATPAKTDAALQVLRKKFSAAGIEMPSLPRTTWDQLDVPARRDLLSSYSSALSSKSLSSQEIRKALNQASDAANKQALIALTRKQLVDPRILSESPPDNDAAQLRAYRHFLVRTGGGAVDTPRSDDDAPPPRKHPPQAGCGKNCAVVNPGEPVPLAPNTALPSGAGAAGKRSGTAGLNGRRDRAFNPVGFLEVAIIDLPDGGTCSGTLLSPTIVLTAAHCVVDYPTTSLRVRLPTFVPNILDQCKQTLDANGRYEQCVDFDLVNVKQAVPHSLYKASDKSNDVAYLVLATPRQDATTAVIEFRDMPPERVTLAGYGDNGLSGHRSLEMQNAIEVGWHIGGALTQGTGKIGWLFAPSGNDSATCHGDSGGPIYEGDYDGGLNDGQHKVFAITSTGSASSCKNFSVQNTNLGSPAIRTWLCKEAPLQSIIGACLNAKSAMASQSTTAIAGDFRPSAQRTSRQVDFRTN